MAVYRQGGKLIDGGDMSGNITSDIMDIQGCTVAGVEYYAASATHVGTLQIQESISGDNWTDVEFTDGTTAKTAASGSAFSGLVNLPGLGGKFLRVTYTFSSGVGSLDVYAIRKNVIG
jgi:hypothetical protein